MRKRLLMAVVLCVLALRFASATEPESLFQSVDVRTQQDFERRFYLSGILGASFGTLTVDSPPSANEPLFTSGGAMGIEFDRPWRLEFEGRARDPIGAVQADTDTTTSFAATGGWSAMVNLWRDIEVTKRLSLYVGGGVGGGGYRFTLAGDSPPPVDVTLQAASIVNSFAWQAGTGVAYSWTDRITLDLGYRFFALDGGNVNVIQSVSGAPYGSFQTNTGFNASELFFAVRIYEPFRAFRR